MRPKRTQLRTSERRGAALLVAIVCVSIAVAVMYGIVQLAIQSHREVNLEQRQTQARWIVESAVDRAAALLGSDPDYLGEQWLLSAEDIGGLDDAEVRIEVEPVTDQADWRQVRIVADYPVELSRRVRQTREFRMPVYP